MPASAQTRPRRRDAERSRRVILDAAETLFARRGYDATSMGAIARRARASSALPAYFFGGKDGLYRAVLERCFAEREHRLEPLADEVVAVLEQGGELPDALHHLIDGYIGFLAERPAFVRLIGWEALRGGRRLRAAPRHSAAVERALRAALAAGDPAPAPGRDPDQLLISVVALCFFPLEHGDTMLSAMGIDAGDPAFISARKAHVVDALMRIIDAGQSARAYPAARLHDELVLQSAASFFAPSGAPARSHPTTYVLCTDDWAIPLAAQEAMSAAADSAVRLQSAHVLQLSHPEVLADVLAGMVRRLWWPTGGLTTAHPGGPGFRGDTSPSVAPQQGPAASLLVKASVHRTCGDTC